MMGGGNLETRSLFDDFRNFDKCGFFDLGHPLLNRIAESFVKAAGVILSPFFDLGFYSYLFKKWFWWWVLQIGAIQAVSREAYFAAVESM